MDKIRGVTAERCDRLIKGAERMIANGVEWCRMVSNSWRSFVARRINQLNEGTTLRDCLGNVDKEIRRRARRFERIIIELPSIMGQTPHSVRFAT